MEIMRNIIDKINNKIYDSLIFIHQDRHFKTFNQKEKKYYEFGWKTLIHTPKAK